MIEPTNGRIVLFTPRWPDPKDLTPEAAMARIILQTYGGKPWAAMITHVWSSRLVNVVVFRPDGGITLYTSVTLLQDDDERSVFGRYAEWPQRSDNAPQIGQLPDAPGGAPAGDYQGA